MITTEEMHQKCQLLLRERTKLQREVRDRKEKIREIERKILQLDLRRAKAEERAVNSSNFN